MHIKIEAECRRGLRIIDEIPDISLCKLEGYNGIGKTNAIKLLRLCAGEQPFRGNDPAWRTFREQLVGAKITITNLREVDQIQWSVDPARWPSNSNTPLGDLLGAVSIDGRSARPRDIPALLQVHHIAAAESPVNILSSRAQESGIQISRWLTTIGNNRQEQLDDLLSSVRSEISRRLPTQLPQDISLAREASQRVNEVKSRLADLRARTNLLMQAVEVANQLDQVRGHGPEMDARLEALKRQLSETEKEKDELDKRIAVASEAQHKSAQAEKEFKNAQQYLDRKDRALQALSLDLEKLAASANVEPNHQAVNEASHQAGARLAELKDLLPRVNATPLLVSVLEDLRDRLEEAVDLDLGDSILIKSIDENADWTTRGLLDACKRQIQILMEKSPSAGSEELSKEIASTRERIDALSRVRGHLRDVKDAENKLDHANERFREAVAQLPKNTVETLQEILSARAELDRKSSIDQANFAKLSHARELLGGGSDEDTLTQKLARLCAEAEVDVGRVRGALERQQSSQDEVMRLEVQAIHEAERTQRVVKERASSLSQLIDLISGSERLRWLRESSPLAARLSEISVTEQVASLKALANDLEYARDRLQATYSSLSGVGSALTELANQIATGSTEDASISSFDVLARSWLANDVRRWFDDETIRSALFDGGTDIQLDTRTLTVSWTVNGERQSRPLSAFSSGQQAFAYTQSRVASLDREEVQPANRLIALDEFGAFLDGNKMNSLITYLKNRQQSSPHDQVVLILPLDRMPEESGISDESQKNIHSLRERGYLTEALGA